MRYAVIGAVAFTERALLRLFERSADVVGVVTLPLDAATKHGDFVDVRPLAGTHGVPVRETRDVNEPETLEWLRRLAPDVVFVFGWSQLFGRELLDVPRVGTLGSHPELLPRGRGRHPITWALVEGLQESGLTIFWLDEGADSGPIAWQRSFPIAADDDAATVYGRVLELADAAIDELLPALEAGTAPRVPQDESRATTRRKRTDDDRRLDWRLPSRLLHDLVRGLARPYVGALARFDGADLLVWRTRVPDEPLPAAAAALAPGTIIAVDGESVDVRTGDGHLLLLELEPRPTTLAPGAVFEAAA
jgi:methionyl-tRNA formyltransferase